MILSYFYRLLLSHGLALNFVSDLEYCFNGACSSSTVVNISTKLL